MNSKESAPIRTTVASRETDLVLPRCFVDLTDLRQPMDFIDIFGREAPLEVEIGVGKGRFLRERAAAFPDRNFLGIEKSLKYLHQAAVRIEKDGLQNVRLICCYVEELFRHYFPAESVDECHILFSDPWPKKRHHKRRLFQPPFLEEVIRVLKSGGGVRVATDHHSYFEVIADLFEHYRSRLSVNFQPEPGPFMTNFQAKYLEEGRKIYFLSAEKLEKNQSSSRSK